MSRVSPDYKIFTETQKEIRMSRIAIVTLMACVLIGCGKTKSPTDDVGKTDAEKSNLARNKKAGNPLPAFTPPTEVVLKSASPSDLKKFIAEHKGQVVLVDYWATWCRPCMAAFPHTVHLSQTYAKHGLVVVSVCMDAVDESQKALDFLKKQEASLVNFGSSLGQDTGYEAFDVGASIPHYKVFGTDGHVILTAVGGEEKKIDAAITNALGVD